MLIDELFNEVHKLHVDLMCRYGTSYKPQITVYITSDTLGGMADECRCSPGFNPVHDLTRMSQIHGYPVFIAHAMPGATHQHSPWVVVDMDNRNPDRRTPAQVYGISPGEDKSVTMNLGRAFDACATDNEGEG